MTSTLQPKTYVYLASCSINNDFPTVGYESPVEYCAAYSTISIACNCSVSTVLNVYVSQNGTTTDRDLFFSQTLAADENFYKKISIAGLFFQVELTNPTSTAGKVKLNTAAFTQTQFAASTFLNSPISINNDTEMVRVANSFHMDLVRDLHNDFQKVNIQGVQKTIPAAGTEQTIGLGRNYVIPSDVESQQVVANAADDPTGTGARSIRYTGILMDNTAFNSNFGTGAGTGLLGLNIKTVNRSIVTSTGTGLKNAGLMEVEESTTGNVLSQVLAGENVSHCAYYGIETDKQLIVHDINIAGSSDATGKVKVIEINPDGIEYTLGEFLITSQYQQFNYVLDGLIPAESVIKVNFENTSSVTTGDILINVNVNAMLCPLKNSF